MDGPEGGSAGKGKGKGRSRDGAGGGASSSTAREEGTPSPNRAAGAGTTYGSLALRLCSSVGAGEMEAPGRKTFFFAVVVSMLALVRNSFLPLHSGYAGAGDGDVPPHLEDDLIRLVLAEQLEGVANTLQQETRSFESLQARRTGALKEIKGFEERLKASASELQELEGLGKAVHEDNSGDAGLATEVSRAQDRLRDLHRSVTGKLDGFKEQLEGQAEAMRGVRDGWATVGQLPERTGDRVAAGVVHEKLEEKLEQYLEELSSFHRSYEATVDDLSPDVITADDLETLLEDAAEPSELAGDNGDGDDPDDEEEAIRSLAEEAVHLAVSRMAGGDDGGGSGGDGDGGCVSEEVLLAEVDAAIGKLVADGTGRRDYANAAVGGKVLTSKGMVSDTYTPPAWWTPSWYWHRAGVENGIGPVESVISEDSSLGACWAMAGSEGFVTIELPEEVTVDAVSVEHASRMVTTESTSAPREFQVWGMRTKDDAFPAKIGGGMYEIDGRPIQTFPIKPLGVKFTVIQVKILSNWGNPNYTCLYRVRVHGRES